MPSCLGHLVIEVGLLLLFIEHLQVLELVVESLVVPLNAISSHASILDVTLSVCKVVPQSRNLKLLHDNLLGRLGNLRLQILDLLLVDAGWFVIEQAALNEATTRLLTLELISDPVISIFLLGVHRGRLVQTRSRRISQFHLFHLIAHLFDLSTDPSLGQGDFCDLLVDL